MDRNEGTHIVTEIHLGKSGKFLTGRSKAVEIIKSLPLDSFSKKVEFDFSGVESFTQSFISELINQLRTNGVSLENISFKSISNQEIRSRADRELDRFNRFNRLTG